MSRLIELPCIVLFGWLAVRYGVFAITRFVAAAAVLGLAYWFVRGARRARTYPGETVLAENFNKP